MTTWVVTRHTGAIEWLKGSGVKADKVVTDLEINDPQKGDIIIGILPIQHVATLNQRGVRYFHICLELLPQDRAKELTAQQMRERSAELVEYQAIRKNHDNNTETANHESIK